MSRIGRPLVDEAKRKGVLALRVDAEERKILEDAAKASDKKLTVWAREVLLAAARQEG